MIESDNRQPREMTGVLLASSRDWLASSMRAVLEPEGYGFRNSTSAAAALHEARAHTPGIVIIDESIADSSVPDLCADLLEEGLTRSVPILVYSQTYWNESEQAAAMQAGAWDIIREPLRSGLLLAKLRRLMQVRRLIEASDGEGVGEDRSGAMTFTDLSRVLGILGSLASRQRARLGCAVLGPTTPAAFGPELEAQRSATARLVVRHTRASDACAWVGDADLALVAYGATIEGLTTAVKRLSDSASMLDGLPGTESLSAGIVELDPDAFRRVRDDGKEPPTGWPQNGHVASLSRIADAQLALQSAREAGGGVRSAEIR
jgi:CheY-like chemotaxis protein